MRTTLLICIFFSKALISYCNTNLQIGVAVNLTYLNPLFSFSGTRSDFTKNQFGYRPEFFVKHFSANVVYKNFLLEYTQYSSFALCAYAFSNNSNSFIPLGVSINRFDDFSSLTNLKRRSLIISKLHEEKKTNFELGGGIAIGNTTGRFQVSKVDTLSTPKGNIFFGYSKNVPSPISIQLGLRLGVDHEFLFKGLHVFANLTYFQGLIKSENITYTTTFKSTTVYYTAISRSSTIGGSIGIRYLLAINSFNRKSNSR